MNHCVNCKHWHPQSVLPANARCDLLIIDPLFAYSQGDGQDTYSLIESEEMRNPSSTYKALGTPASFGCVLWETKE